MTGQLSNAEAAQVVNVNVSLLWKSYLISSTKAFVSILYKFPVNKTHNHILGTSHSARDTTKQHF